MLYSSALLLFLSLLLVMLDLSYCASIAQLLFVAISIFFTVIIINTLRLSYLRLFILHFAAGSKSFLLASCIE